MTTIWDWRAKFYDVCEGSRLRRGPSKAALFREMSGRVILVAVGTGVDFMHFPPGREIVGIDISDQMLRRAEARRQAYDGSLSLVRMDAQELKFPDASFDTAVTSCTMCSVPDPVAALRELHRVLRPGSRLLMFEHVRSRNPVFGAALDIMTLWTRLWGTTMNRDTLTNVRSAGFHIVHVESVYLDIILRIYAVKPDLGDKALSGIEN
jgi:ubiquinone/menaquinone biosynthesis C-methylase UbiE